MCMYAYVYTHTHTKYILLKYAIYYYLYILQYSMYIYSYQKILITDMKKAECISQMQINLSQHHNLESKHICIKIVNNTNPCWKRNLFRVAIKCDLDD